MRRRLVALGVVFSVVALALSGGYAWYRFGARETPAGQPPLVSLDASNFDRVQAVFNAASSSRRIVLLFSPT